MDTVVYIDLVSLVLITAQVAASLAHWRCHLSELFRDL